MVKPMSDPRRRHPRRSGVSVEPGVLCLLVAASLGCARTTPDPAPAAPIATLSVPTAPSDPASELATPHEPTDATWSVELFYLSEQTLEQHCEATLPVTRTIRPTPNRADALLRALFAPLTRAERDRGLISPHHGHVGAPDAPGLGECFVGVTIDDGVATVAFTGASMEYLNQAACAQTAVKSSIERTLHQLPEVERVEYVVDGHVVVEWDA